MTKTKKWNKFENDCFEYLKNNFSNYASFKAYGKSDSTVADIEVDTKSGNKFFIEVKHSPAHCGQFVLIPDENEKKFIFSSNNKSKPNKFTKEIIDYMNKNFEMFLHAGTKGEDIVLESSAKLFADWIIDKYNAMDVKYFIVNNYNILALQDILKFFDIIGKFRIKKSGSGEPPKMYYTHIENILKNKYDINNFELVNSNKKTKMFVKSEKDMAKEYFVLQNYTYQFSETDEPNRYEVRKLSNTRNMNVIFSIRLKKAISGLSKEKFISFLTLHS